MAQMKKAGVFDPILSQEVDISKVNIDIMTKWITEKSIELLEGEDDVFINYVVNCLEAKNLNGRKLQLDITGFLNKKAAPFTAGNFIILTYKYYETFNVSLCFTRVVDAAAGCTEKSLWYSLCFY